MLLEAGCGCGERMSGSAGVGVRINNLGFTYSVYRIITALYLVYKCNLQLVLIHRIFYPKLQ